MSDTTTSTNPGNFTNRPTEEVKAIASMGGKASHGSHPEQADETAERPDSVLAAEGRNPDGTFMKGGAAAKEAGHHSHDDHDKKEEDTGRNADGTFKAGSEAAKQAGRLGGLHSHDNDEKKD